MKIKYFIQIISLNAHLVNVEEKCEQIWFLKNVNLVYSIDFMSVQSKYFPFQTSWMKSFSVVRKVDKPNENS